MDDIEEMTLLEAIVLTVTTFLTLVMVSTLGYYWDLWTSVREYLW